MSANLLPDYSLQLESLMQQAGISDLEELSRKAGVSSLQLLRLRRGLALQTRVEILLKISRGLNISLSELLATFAPETITDTGTQETASLEELQQEYQRLQSQLEQQRMTLIQEFQQGSLQILESWLLQWPTAAYRAKENPQLDAVKLLPLVRPVEQLIQQWGIEAIAPVGSQVTYNPYLHQLLEGTAQPGDPVLVRYTGYRQGDKLLYRAKVSPISGN